jgi:hypothetical protein
MRRCDAGAYRCALPEQALKRQKWLCDVPNAGSGSFGIVHCHGAAAAIGLLDASSRRRRAARNVGSSRRAQPGVRYRSGPFVVTEKPA